jgi:CheY-like chemotaxis protein
MTPDPGSTRPVEILLVEDSPTDAKLTMEALGEGKIESNIHHVVDGVEAMAFLRREGRYADAPRPDLILLDLNLPKMDGREVLEEIRSDAKLEDLLVTVLTTSREEKDVLASYGFKANAYVTKPVDLDELFDVVKTINDFWFRIVTLPPREDRR